MSERLISLLDETTKKKLELFLANTDLDTRQRQWLDEIMLHAFETTKTKP